MDVIHLIVFAAGLAAVLGGARMLYCGHKSIRAGRHDRRAADRRGTERRRAA